MGVISDNQVIKAHKEQINLICETTCKNMGLGYSEVKFYGRKEVKPFADALKMVCYMLNKHTELTVPQMGIVAGILDTDVRSAINRIEKLSNFKDYRFRITNRIDEKVKEELEKWEEKH